MMAWPGTGEKGRHGGREVAGGWKPQPSAQARERVAGTPVMRAATAVRRVALGAMTRTGSVTLVAVCGTRRWPVFAGRWEAPLMPAGLPAQPYHAAADVAIDAAESMIGRGEAAAEEAALAALSSVVADLPATTMVTGVAVVVKAATVPRSVAAVLRSHAWMHAAEGLLYRDAVLAAARRCGWAAHAVEGAALPAADEVITGMGAVAGRPWRRAEKDAARAALTLLSAG
jgi:hypothetical protein